jgi:hypothetical protein
MPWQQKDVARAGEFLLISKIDGVWIDPLGSIKAADIIARVREYAAGWTPLSIDLAYGLIFGIDGHLYIFGQATTPIPTADVAGQVRAALDSFFQLAATDVSVSVSDTMSAPVPTPKGEWSGTLQLIAVAVIVVAVVYGVKQIKDITS